MGNRVWQTQRMGAKQQAQRAGLKIDVLHSATLHLLPLGWPAVLVGATHGRPGRRLNQEQRQ